jgi:hypothetical protein
VYAVALPRIHGREVRNYANDCEVCFGVFRSHHDEVRLFVLGCLARDGAKGGVAREWERVFERVPGLKEFMEHTTGLTREVRREKVMEVEAYMCTPCPESRQK